MTAARAARAVEGKVMYSQCWEDPRTASRGLGLRGDDDVVVITSAGCNAIALALAGPRSVTAVDFNPAQSHLLELKIAAITTLDHASLVAFLGVRHSRERLRIYRDALAPRLSAAGRRYWGARPSMLARGVLHAGRFERYLALFRSSVLRLMERKADIDRLLALDSLDEQRQFYERTWDNWRWRSLFVLFFGRLAQARVGRHPEVFRYVDVSNVGEHYRECARHALVDLPLADNYFVEYILTGGYSSEARMPTYLRASAHASVREAVARIRVVTADVGAFLAATPRGTYSAFSFSDIFEWMSPAEHEGVLRAAISAARPGARLCYYNNLVLRRCPASLAGAFETDETLSDRLHHEDRSFLYRRFAIEHLREGAEC
ncbi:MAG: BtaA family protein [Chloroflexota bacterium]|nr:BtaA family protein [Chloroflexota bacterium]